MPLQNTTCPVCGNQELLPEIEFCPQCKWEHIQIPANASPGLQQYYKKRLDTHRALYKEIRNLKIAGELLAAEKEQLTKQNTQLTQDLAKERSSTRDNSAFVQRIRDLEKTVEEKDKKIKDVENRIFKL